MRCQPGRTRSMTSGSVALTTSRSSFAMRWRGSGASTGDDARPGDRYGAALADGAGSPEALGAGDGAGVIAGIGGAVAIGPLPVSAVP